MPFSASVRQPDVAASDAPLLAILTGRGRTMPEALRAADAAVGGAIERAFASGDFRGGRDETLALSGGARGPRRIVLVGMGEATERGPALKRAAAVAARQAAKLGTGTLAVLAPDASGDELEQVALGLHAGAWRYDDLKTPPPADERRAPVESAVVLSADPGAAAAVERGTAIGEGQALARRLAMMPGNLCTPQFLAETARDIAQRHGLAVNVLGRDDLEAERMGSFLSVAQGTPQEPQLVALEYRRGQGRPIVLVGKGLCFDTGGISIKPAQSMELMKFDMCGAAGVLGAIEAIARLDLKIDVVGIIGATTNMPSGTAVKPGDVVRSRSGKTIEIINTDAEGRLVLADLLDYAARYEPAAVVDAATLTGACVIALGHTATGVFGGDQGLVDEVLAAGRRAGEAGWQLPVWDDYKELIRSDVADVKNTGGRAAGSITAALFLKEFAGAYPWVHLDIAGTAYSESDLVALPKGPTGVPVGTFVEFVRGRAG
ncbi:MAG TPA: leucyl aminopeptidase [Gemmatimonadaceae bacterium]|nr:leucyl aminopeptidase [Gemmatimonadaceae bacterium]